MIGQTIAHYTILEKLGEGGMGVVYKAEDSKLRRTVALKFLPPAILASETDRTRFVHEAQASASLNHPCIATVYEINETEARTFIALEYVEGHNLAEKLATGPIDPKEAIGIAIQLSEGLRAAHEKGIVHRDVKPQNIMVTAKGQVKILDFGLAKLRGSSPLTRVGMTLGTSGYMSPEQLLGEAVDHRTDLWAVGVVLYEMIAGTRPFRGEFEAAVSYQVLNGHHEPLTAVRPGVPEILDAIIDRLLAKQIHQRYQTIDEVLADLHSLAVGVPPATKHHSPRRRIIPRKVLIGGGIIVAAVLVTAAIRLYVLPSRPFAGEKKSVAVLPFQNFSDNKQDEYFSDGMTDELINALVKVEGLRVPARTSVFVFKDKQEDVRRISEQLNVSTVLEGSVRRAGNRIRISTQLINAADGFSLWAETYEREVKDVFAVQDDITRRIVDVLKVALQDGRGPAARSVPHDLKAYDLYLWGMYHVNKRSANDISLGLAEFQKAIAVDTLYALAYAGISEAYVLLSSQAAMSPREAYPKALAAARQAVRLDDRSVEAHTCLAHIFVHLGRDEEAGRELRRALELGPQYAPAYQFATEYFTQIRQLDSARASIQRSLELGPLDLAANAALANTFILDKKYDEAVERLHQTLQLDSNYFLAHIYLGDVYAATGRNGRAADEYALVARLTGGNRGLGALGRLYATVGKHREARAILEEMSRRSLTRYTSPLEIARICAALGDRDRTLLWLEKAVDDDPWSLKKMEGAAQFKSLQGERRFKALISRAKDL
jgi:eukaryotic-like serine/threonine-protein kinase